ncbi:hypothetical protein C8F01DRAFT_922484, partial [Mycena amicta]
YDSKRPTWQETLQFFSKLGVMPFGDSLTAMQTVTTLAFCQVVEMPTVSELGEWIARHQTLGAVRGLHYIGFDVSSSDQVIASFTMFHNLLDNTLTSEQKEIVKFHVAFSENLWCKMIRWVKTLKE